MVKLITKMHQNKRFQTEFAEIKNRWPEIAQHADHPLTQLILEKWTLKRIIVQDLLAIGFIITIGLFIFMHAFLDLSVIFEQIGLGIYFISIFSMVYIQRNSQRGILYFLNKKTPGRNLDPANDTSNG